MKPNKIVPAYYSRYHTIIVILIVMDASITISGFRRIHCKTIIQSRTFNVIQQMANLSPE